VFPAKPEPSPPVAVPLPPVPTPLPPAPEAPPLAATPAKPPAVTKLPAEPPAETLGCPPLALTPPAEPGWALDPADPLLTAPAAPILMPPPVPGLTPPGGSETGLRVQPAVATDKLSQQQRTTLELMCLALAKFPPTRPAHRSLAARGPRLGKQLESSPQIRG